MKKLTAKQVRKFLNYNPKTGIFTQRLSRQGTKGAGTIAGKLTKSGYIYIGIARRGAFAHRLAWLWVHGRWPKVELDHKNGVRSDNRLNNLREASRNNNMHNRKIHRNNTSGTLGVSFRVRDAKWRAYICVNNKNFHLGSFPTKAKAVEKRRIAEELLFGEFNPTTSRKE